MALVVMLNNYFHDLATAVFAVSAFAAWRVDRVAVQSLSGPLRKVARDLVRVGWGALAWTVLAGIPRTLAFRRYEWMEAAGRDQIPVLVAKHVVLVTFVGLGVAALVTVHRRLRAATPEVTP